MTGATQPATTAKRRSRLRLAAYILLVLILLVVAAFGGLAWYFSSAVVDVSHDHPTYDQRVLALHGNTVEVTRTSDTILPGTFGLTWHGGHVILGAILSSNQQGVVRRFTGIAHGLRVGTHVHFDALMYASPAAFHLTYRTVSVPGPLGILPAWFIPGKRTTWALIVHGRGMARTEGLRAVPTLAGLGLPILDVTYRNDLGAPASSDHLFHLGGTEWQDVQAGARYALAHGARDLILYGYSMGGTTSEAFLHRSPLARRVRAAVLDSPALDWNAILDLGARNNHVPDVLAVAAKRVVSWRIGVGPLASISGVRSGADFRVPTLLFHGTGDTEVPFASNAALARSRPDLVTFVPFAGAQHTHEWNTNRGAYTAHLRAFLVRLLK
ncbi:MAG: alpha/beta fold hydrolase [Chloroflexota bacterium]